MIVIIIIVPLEPRSVQQLVVRNTGETSMSVHWKQPVSEWDSFTVLLGQVDRGITVAQRYLSWEARDCTFNLLTPGRLYTITVVTNSRNLSSSVSVTARTSTCNFIPLLLFCKDGMLAYVSDVFYAMAKQNVTCNLLCSTYKVYCQCRLGLVC